MTAVEYASILGGFTGIIIVLIIGINLGSKFITDKKFQKLKAEHDEVHEIERKKLIGDIVDFFMRQQRNGRTADSSGLDEIRDTMSAYKTSNLGFSMRGEGDKNGKHS